MLFNRADVLDGAARRIASAPPATPGERAAIDAEVFAETSMSLSAPAALDREYEKYIDDIEADNHRRRCRSVSRLADGELSRRLARSRSRHRRRRVR